MWAERVGDFFRTVRRDEYDRAAEFYDKAVACFDAVSVDAREDPSGTGWGWDWSAEEILERCLTVVAKLATVLQEMPSPAGNGAGHSVRIKNLHRRYLTTSRVVTDEEHRAGSRRAEQLVLVQQDLAWLYTAESDHCNAEPLFRAVYVSLGKRWGDRHHLTLRARARLADCLENQGRSDEARTLQGANAAQNYYQQSDVLLVVNRR